MTITIVGPPLTRWTCAQRLCALVEDLEPGDGRRAPGGWGGGAAGALGTSQLVHGATSAPELDLDGRIVAHVGEQGVQIP